MAIEENFNRQTEEGKMYFPPTYEADGFIHATAEPQSLLPVGTHFYKETVGDWICLKLDVTKLGGPVVYEAPMPVGNIEAYDHEGDKPLFPHIYGGIPRDSVMETYKIIRAEDGTFLEIQGLVSNASS